MIDGSVGIGEQQRRMIVDSYRIDEHVRHFPLIAALAQPCACQSGFRIILMIGGIYGKEQIPIGRHGKSRRMMVMAEIRRKAADPDLFIRRVVRRNREQISLAKIRLFRIRRGMNITGRFLMHSHAYTIGRIFRGYPRQCPATTRNPMK